jgi:hypothetical protein
VLVGYYLVAKFPQETDFMILRKRLAAAQGHHLIVILYAIEQETFSGFVIISGPPLVEKWLGVGLLFDGGEPSLVHGNLESLAAQEASIPKAF